jgi:hypothetical protein
MLLSNQIVLLYNERSLKFNGCRIRGMNCLPFLGAWVPAVFCGVRVAQLCSFLCCVYCFSGLPPVSCVPNVASCYGLSILIVPSVFSNIYLKKFHNIVILFVWDVGFNFLITIIYFISILTRTTHPSVRLLPR